MMEENWRGTIHVSVGKQLLEIEIVLMRDLKDVSFWQRRDVWDAALSSSGWEADVLEGGSGIDDARVMGDG